MIYLSWKEILKTFEYSDDLYQQVAEICLLSADKKNFANEQEKQAFTYRWVGQYFKLFNDFAFIALEQDRVLGYICGCPSTETYRLKLDQQGLSWWHEKYPQGYDLFPAHLHINCHPDARGKGVGAKLLTLFEDYCRSQKLPGVHLVTVKGARNVGFYQRAGYLVQSELELNESTLVFLGKKLFDS